MPALGCQPNWLVVVIHQLPFGTSGFDWYQSAPDRQIFLLESGMIADGWFRLRIKMVPVYYYYYVNVIIMNFWALIRYPFGPLSTGTGPTWDLNNIAHPYKRGIKLFRPKASFWEPYSASFYGLSVTRTVSGFMGIRSLRHLGLSRALYSRTSVSEALDGLSLYIRGSYIKLTSLHSIWHRALRSSGLKFTPWTHSEPSGVPQGVIFFSSVTFV